MRDSLVSAEAFADAAAGFIAAGRVARAIQAQTAATLARGLRN